MECVATAIEAVKILTPRRFGDARGMFCETYNRQKMAAMGIEVEFVQDNHSVSVPVGVLRGMHFQVPPMAQAKLVRVIRGSVLDVAVDLRRNSPTFGKHVSVNLSAENGRQVFIPAGFAHGFVTLEPNTEVIYKVSNYYSPAHERGIRWNDPAVGIDWPVADEKLTMTDRDRNFGALEGLKAVEW